MDIVYAFMPRTSTGRAKESLIRVEPTVLAALKSLKKAWYPTNTEYKIGDVVKDLVIMSQSRKKTGTLAFLEESQNPKLNEGALLTEMQNYKFLYEDSQKNNANFVKIVQNLANQLGISYPEAMELRVDATIQQ